MTRVVAIVTKVTVKNKFIMETPNSINLPGKWIVATREHFIVGNSKKDVLFAVKHPDGSYTNNYFLRLSFEKQEQLGKLLEQGLVLVWEPLNTAAWIDPTQFAQFGINP